MLPAYLVGMALAPFFMGQRELQLRLRAICFAFLTPFYFLKAGSLIEANALIAGAGLIAVFLAMKMVTQLVGILPLTRYFKFDQREGMYTTLMMSTGLTFGSISALFGLTNHIIDQEQYTVLLTAVIGSAVVPTLIAQIWFHPRFRAVGGGCLVHAANLSAEDILFCLITALIWSEREMHRGADCVRNA